MKTKATTIHTRLRNTIVSRYRDGVRISAAMLMLIGFTLTSCSEDDKSATPDTRQQFVGSYTVKDISATTGYEYQYGVSIAVGSKGVLEITNFANILDVPVKAKADGNQLVIESQTFNGTGGQKLKVEGSGTFANNVLTFTYTTVGAINYTGNCTAKKSQ